MTYTETTRPLGDKRSHRRRDTAALPALESCIRITPRCCHGMGLPDRPRLSGEAGLGPVVLPGEGRTTRARISVRGPLARPGGQGLRQRAPAGDQGPGLVGPVP